jgi:hypothetical protein
LVFLGVSASPRQELLCGYNLNIREDLLAKDRSPKKEVKKPKKKK